MRKSEKVMVLITFAILLPTAYIIGNATIPQPVVIELSYYEIWKDDPETVVNRTIIVYYRWRWEKKIFRYSFEVFRSKDASDAIRWALTQPDRIIIVDNEVYGINKTIVLEPRK